MTKSKKIARPQSTSAKIVSGSASLETCSLVIENFTGDTVSVKYTGLPANQAKSYKNFVAIWQASMIPWNVPPIANDPIPNNNQSGSFVIDNIVITNDAYIIGYGVGPEITDICATSVISPGGLIGSKKHVSIALNSYGSNSVSIHYETLPGYLPKQYGNWVAIYQGANVSPYNAPPPIGKAEINSDSNEGNVGINGILLGINSQYTIIYYMGTSNTTAAAILTFSTKTNPVTRKLNAELIAPKVIKPISINFLTSNN